MTELQIKILETIKEDYMTCDDIAFKLGKHKMHIGNSIKSLLKKGLVDAWYDRPYPTKYINCN